MNNITSPFSAYFQQLFPQDTLRVLYIELDPGVDDSAALFQLLARRVANLVSSLAKQIEVLGTIPCFGNVVLSQAEENTLKLLETAGSQDIAVYTGAIAPLDFENNQTAIQLMDQNINATHFYGYDGEADVGGWPTVTMALQPSPGYQFSASLISNTPTDSPLTLLSTSPLTTLSKTLRQLVAIDAAGTFAKKIAAISIMGGCVDPKVGCNAPFTVPNDQKTSEANFFIDPPAAQNVFAICQKYQIPILLAPLDLTQEAGLLWTKKQVEMLQQINNPAAQQMARISETIPYIDALNFPNGTYPMHDLQAVTPLLFPQFYNVTRLAVTIGEIGQMIINATATDEEKNVYVLGMSLDNQASFYQTVLVEYTNFSPSRNQSARDKIITLLIILGALLFTAMLIGCTVKKWRGRKAKLIITEELSAKNYRNEVGFSKI
jgi:purine nucleosidase